MKYSSIDLSMCLPCQAKQRKKDMAKQMGRKDLNINEYESVCAFRDVLKRMSQHGALRGTDVTFVIIRWLLQMSSIPRRFTLHWIPSAVWMTLKKAWCASLSFCCEFFPHRDML